jgi:cell division protein FtsQ
MGAAMAADAGSRLALQSAALGLRLQDVRLSGASAAAAPDILRAAALEKGVPLASVDLDAVRRRVEAVGWVRDARVTRLYPATVVVAVDERHLVAVWEHGGHTGVIDDAGVIAPEADPARFAALPLAVGDGANTAIGAILPHLASRPRLARRLVALVRVDGRRWDLALTGGEIIQLPAADEEGALIRLDQLDQQSRVLDLGFSRIDLRDPEMVLVRPRQGRTADAGQEPAG